ncbi:TetR/AcrR family transcriptional regulator [Microbispora bryophytorum]|uniref:TetR/AcrR family transcriptional regulator n=1 Tax=Microbispora bryophytorum TaxID=1460882 RepID=UPI0033CB597B
MTVTTSGPDPEDLTARARIRDAALQHFGEHGFERATIRGIAETAGVSSGLVRHHFGSKQELREVCDTYLTKMIRRLNDQVRADTVPGDVNYVALGRVALGPHQQYLVRALTEGWAAPVFDELVELGEQWLAEADAKRPDPPYAERKVRAALGVAMALSVPILHRQLSRAMGFDVFSPEGDHLLARAMLDIYSHPILSPEEAAEMRDALDKIHGTPPRAERVTAIRQDEEHDHD